MSKSLKLPEIRKPVAQKPTPKWGAWIPKPKPKFPKSLMVILIDINPAQKFLRDDPSEFLKVVDGVIAFANAHLMLGDLNEVAFIASHTNQSHFIYPLEIAPGEQTKPIRPTDGQHEAFVEVEKIVRLGIKRLILDNSYVTPESSEESSSNEQTCIASSLAKALCYINRKSEEAQEDEILKSRIIIFTGNTECSSQYNYLMSSFFAANVQGIAIDVCVLGQYATLISQGADITGGIYIRPPQLGQGLLQYLLWVFLPDPATRKKMVLPPQLPIDYRTACFCCRKLISVGFVCSVCFCVFCKFSPICSTCHTVFKDPVRSASMALAKQAQGMKKLKVGGPIASSSKIKQA